MKTFCFQNFELKVMSTVVNDTVGTMVSCAFDHPKTCMGLIVGMFDYKKMIKFMQIVYFVIECRLI